MSTEQQSQQRKINKQKSQDAEEKRPVDDLMEYWKQYAQERPEVCAMWCFGIGFVLGWKLKPW